LFAAKFDQCVFGFLQRGEDNFFVGSEAGQGAGVGGVDAGADVAEVEGSPGDTRAESPGVGS